ncbi:MAG: lipoate--protein ligase family protein [Candidatus Thorarchaeota archaeon]|nr:MAG: lipoate--protein ligase family protein [Candidatus Thorarchaeota archaeon]
MDEVRFLDLEIRSAHMNMALDEAIMRSIQAGHVPPTLRLYRWQPSAVSIGTFQGMTEEVDLEYCKRNGIDHIRRLTGGGAVYHDYGGEVTYSIILPNDHRLVSSDIIESYKILCAGVVKALDILGIDAKFKPINDVVTGGKKISGNAQTRRRSCVLQHGTTLLDLDVEVMFSVLKVPQEKISDKMIEDVRQRVTSVREVLGREVGVDELVVALGDGFGEALGIELVEGELSAAEIELAESLVEEKYGRDEWNLSR